MVLNRGQFYFQETFGIVRERGLLSQLSDVGVGRGSCWHLVLEVRDVAEQPSIHRTAPSGTLSDPGVNSTEFEKSCVGRTQPVLLSFTFGV